MTNEQILNETYLNPTWFRIENNVPVAIISYKFIGNVIIDENFSSNHHLVYFSDNIKNNCFIKDTSADDVRDCPNCRRAYKPVD